MKDELLKALPQMVFLVVLVINLITSAMDSDRSFKASLTATFVLISLTYWGGFYQPLLHFIKK